MTEEDRISYLNFMVGALWGTVVTIRDSKDCPPEIVATIADRLAMINPLLNKVYEYQREQESSANRVRETRSGTAQITHS